MSLLLCLCLALPAVAGDAPALPAAPSADEPSADTPPPAPDGDPEETPGDDATGEPDAATTAPAAAPAAPAAPAAATPVPGSMSMPYRESVGVSDARWAEARALLAEYERMATTIVVGEVLTNREEYGPEGMEDVVSISTTEVLRGSPSPLTDVHMPARRIGAEQVKPTLVQGYSILVFLDQDGVLVDGDAAFVIDGGYAFRSRREGIFMHPRSDRDWVNNIDPTADYVVLPLADVRAACAAPAKRTRRWGRH